jgi:hypothetical protein
MILAKPTQRKTPAAKYSIYRSRLFMVHLPSLLPSPTLASDLNSSGGREKRSAEISEA